MNLTQIRQSIRHLKARVFGLPPAEQQYGRQELEELATAIREFGRMRQEHYGSRSIVLGAGELAMRLRETTRTIVKALEVLRDQGGCSRNRRTRTMETALHRRADAGLSIGRSRKAR